jgi:hypothetical protein
MKSKATTVDEYLAGLPEERRAAIAAVRRTILENLDRDYEECMQYGMIGYCVPHRVYPKGLHTDPRQPLPFVNLASQKNYMTVYLMSVYSGSDEEVRFRNAWAKTGKKLDMGKSCIRFRKPDDLALEVIAEAIRRCPAKAYIEQYEGALAQAAKARAARRTARRKTSRRA